MGGRHQSTYAEALGIFSYYLRPTNRPFTPPPLTLPYRGLASKFSQFLAGLFYAAGVMRLVLLTR